MQVTLPKQVDEQLPRHLESWWCLPACALAPAVIQYNHSTQKTVYHAVMPAFMPFRQVVRRELACKRHCLSYADHSAVAGTYHTVSIHMGCCYFINTQWVVRRIRQHIHLTSSNKSVHSRLDTLVSRLKDLHSVTKHSSLKGCGRMMIPVVLAAYSETLGSMRVYNPARDLLFYSHRPTAPLCTTRTPLHLTKPKAPFARYQQPRELRLADSRGTVVSLA